MRRVLVRNRSFIQCSINLFFVLALFIALKCENASAQQTNAPDQMSQNGQPKSAGTVLPPITVQPPKVKRRSSAGHTPANNAAAKTLPAQAPNLAASSAQGSASTLPLERIASVGKTGTQVGDIPASIQVVPRDIISEQGGVTLQDSIKNVSGVNVGGPSTYGFFDRFSIRGLDARIYSDGFSDGDQLNGIPHSLNGVSQIEVLKGPGSALLGTGPAGGSINIVHYLPTSTPLYGVGTQIGAYGTVSSTFFANGPTTVPGMNYRIDALVAHSDGFRDQKSADYELRPTISWTGEGHVVTVSVDLRHIEQTPDPFGILYLNGKPLNISTDTKYYSPFSRGNQDMERLTISDAWTVNRFLTVNNRVSYTHRDVDILRDGAGGTIAGTSFTGRALREQTEQHDDINYMFEPVWRFATGPIRHTLVTGAQVDYEHIEDNRATATLQNISNIFAPVIPETSTQGLSFLRDATHSGFIDHLDGTFLGLYATDQIDVTDSLKLRFSARQDWWDRELTPQIFVPGRFDPNGQLFEPGVTESRIDTPFSWSAGALYKVIPGVAPFVGVSRSYLANFNTEATQNGVAAPESALQYEAGVKFSGFDDRITLTTSAFQVQRQNVFTLVGDTVFFDDQQTRGVEADLQLKPTPEWKILANFTAQDAVLTGVPQTPAAVGKIPIGIPAHLFNLWTTYDFSMAGVDGFKIGAGVSYSDKTYGDQLNTLSIPYSTVFDAALSYKVKDWDITLGMKNITDVTYYTAALGAGGAPGLPRTVYLKANYRW
jgi:iron complex outermembrane recepter protein